MEEINKLLSSETTNTSGVLDPSLTWRGTVPPRGDQFCTRNSWTLNVCPTTGSPFEIQMDPAETVDNFKKTVSKKLNIGEECINLLFRERELIRGRLNSNGLADGSKITLLPSLEAGILQSNRAKKCDGSAIAQALENLSEKQVNDFLSGEAPLTLSIRLGEHLMFVQLELSVNSQKRRAAAARARNNTLAQNGANTAKTNIGPVLPTTPHNVSSSSNERNAPTRPSILSSLPVVERRALMETSRHLSERLKQISRLTPPGRPLDTAPVTQTGQPPANPSKCDGVPAGAVIDTMKHIGKGVYSGTFSGTLNPSLQDRDGKPRKSLGTIVQILNDLLGVASHPPARSPPQRLRHIASEARAQLHSENQAMRGKVQHVQRMMQERRMRRHARRTAGMSPYLGAWRPRAREPSNEVSETVTAQGPVLA